ncbi:MAG TPA: PadR family transcriptional regulator [Bacteroidales bacterium]|nr:PadR family transcriptional regulator [Bacteroidales bacterium]
MSTISNKEAALLGLLSVEAKYPYEIEKEIYNQSMRDWTEISMSSVYKVLAKLEEKDLVISEVKMSESNRAQKVYTVTPRGRRLMQGWITARTAKWEKSLWPIDIAMSNLALLPKEEIIENFRSYIQSVDESIKCYNDLLGYLTEHCQYHSLSLATRPLLLLQADRKWAEEVLAHYEQISLSLNRKS